ncbi:hypothetical protein [Leclercia adecarboxylata]|uniref:hypothetical protein n=1 Tax=Leclercia adecarboxylata TaxID=83655 RepID=UPI001428D7B0|nr:hypothetical protein [Leclercia adecarboxylata]
MDSDSISLAAMLVAKEASNWAFWTMLASAVSAFAAVVTIVVAIYALNSWHKQEALKVQVNFKHAILDLKDALLAMPQRWSYIDINVARNLINQYPTMSHQTNDRTNIFFKKNEVTAAYDQAVKCWIMCDGLFENKGVKDLWKEFSSQYKTYIKTGGERGNMESILDQISGELKLF